MWIYIIRFFLLYISFTASVKIIQVLPCIVYNRLNIVYHILSSFGFLIVHPIVFLTIIFIIGMLIHLVCSWSHRSPTSAIFWEALYIGVRVLNPQLVGWHSLDKIFSRVSCNLLRKYWVLLISIFYYFSLIFNYNHSIC